MARPSGFFNSTASLKPAFAFSTATGTSTDHFSYFARTLNDHFLPPSLSFLSLRLDDPPRWIIILALLDRIFGADDLRCRERAFARPLPIRSRTTYPTRCRKRILEFECAGTIVLFLRVTNIRVCVCVCVATISFAPLDKRWRSRYRFTMLTPERNLTSHLEPKKRANHRASPAVNDKL